jgi:iron complex transport system substrate-binding protein
MKNMKCHGSLWTPAFRFSSVSNSSFDGAPTSASRLESPLNSVLFFRYKALMKRGTLFVGLFLFLLGSPQIHAGQNHIQITDFRGKAIVLARPAERIVCLIESALSGLFMLGVQERVVGISRNVYQSNVFPYYAAMDARIRSKRIPAPGNWDFVNLESVVALRPDLVILWSQQTESIAALEKRGIPVYGVFIQSLEDVYKEMTDLGRLTDRVERADDLTAYTRNEIQRFRRRIAPIPLSERPAVYYMWAQGNLETSCGGSTVNALIELAGGRNVCRHIRREHAAVNLETLIAWNPEVILMWHNPNKNPGAIRKDPQWERISAIQADRVHEFPEIFVCDLWTLKFLFAVKMTAKWIHPGKFEDIDLEEEKRRMLNILYDGMLKSGAHPP